MDFHLAFTPKPFTEKIRHTDPLLLIGSCFTENIGVKLKQLKFPVLENPHGILFNPVSIATAIDSYISNKTYTAEELFYANECWNSWQHHSRFSHPDQKACLHQINQSQQSASRFLQEANWVMITLGSSFVYQLAEGDYVANCHKVPTDKFTKHLLSATENIVLLQQVISQLKSVSPTIRIIFTISPVRHLRDGFVENSRSKANLVAAVHSVIAESTGVYYFPAYELVIDDLRDYRFYAEDMVHPNYAATNYVWEKFMSACMDEETLSLMKEINVINAARQHKPFHPGSEQHKKFLATHLQKIKDILSRYPHVPFEEELAYFNSGC